MIIAEQKTELLARIARHGALDTIAQGAYADAGGNGLLRVCAVGCAMVEPADETPSINDWHRAMEDMWGIPAWLGELEDRVFEGLPLEEAKTWPRRFVEAIPVGLVGGVGANHPHPHNRLKLYRGARLGYQRAQELR